MRPFSKPALRLFPAIAIAALMSSSAAWGQSVPAEQIFDLETATIADINAAFEAGALTSEALVELYLARIAAYDEAGPELNSFIIVNPDALEIARALDEERAFSGPRSPLHGIPVVFKDVFDTADMPTTGGFLPMAGSQAEQAIADMRDAGALVMDPVETPFDLYNELRQAGVTGFERKESHNYYLSNISADAPIQSIAEMVEAAPDIVKSGIRNSLEDGPLDRNPEYLAALAQRHVLRDALVALMDELDLDVLAMPLKTIAVPDLYDETGNFGSDSRIHSVTGLPSIVVPGGVTESDGMPFGWQFIGRPFSEPTLLTIASGFEAHTRHRFSPPLTPPLEGESFSYTATVAAAD